MKDFVELTLSNGEKCRGGRKDKTLLKALHDNQKRSFMQSRQ